MSELSAAAIKELKVGELNAELLKQDLSILKKEEEHASRLMKVICHSLLKPEPDEADKGVAIADLIDSQVDAEGKRNEARHEEEYVEEAFFDDSFFQVS